MSFVLLLHIPPFRIRKLERNTWLKRISEYCLHWSHSGFLNISVWGCAGTIKPCSNLCCTAASLLLEQEQREHGHHTSPDTLRCVCRALQPKQTQDKRRPDQTSDICDIGRGNCMFFFITCYYCRVNLSRSLRWWSVYVYKVWPAKQGAPSRSRRRSMAPVSAQVGGPAGRAPPWSHKGLCDWQWNTLKEFMIHEKLIKGVGGYRQM